MTPTQTPTSGIPGIINNPVYQADRYDLWNATLIANLAELVSAVSDDTKAVLCFVAYNAGSSAPVNWQLLAVKPKGVAYTVPDSGDHLVSFTGAMTTAWYKGTSPYRYVANVTVGFSAATDVQLDGYRVDTTRATMALSSLPNTSQVTRYSDACSNPSTLLSSGYWGVSFLSIP